MEIENSIPYEICDMHAQPSSHVDKPRSKISQRWMLERWCGARKPRRPLKLLHVYSGTRYRRSKEDFEFDSFSFLSMHCITAARMMDDECPAPWIQWYDTLVRIKSSVRVVLGRCIELVIDIL
jgi:hypothetical protein